MKKLLLIFLVGIFLISFSGAVKICIDNTAPSAPSNLMVSGEVGNIVLTWSPATDEPNCSGIEKYVISREGIKIGQTNGLSFIDLNKSLGVGNYTYTVYAVDMVGHNTGRAVIIAVTIENNGGNNVVHTSGGVSNFICHENWTCENWTGCTGNEQRRLCNDISKCGTIADKPNTDKKCGNTDNYGKTNDSATQHINKVNNKNKINSNGFFSGITGAVIGGASTTGGKIIISIVGLIFLMLIILVLFKRKFRK